MVGSSNVEKSAVRIAGRPTRSIAVPSAGAGGLAGAVTTAGDAEFEELLQPTKAESATTKSQRRLMLMYLQPGGLSPRQRQRRRQLLTDSGLSAALMLALTKVQNCHRRLQVVLTARLMLHHLE